MWSLCTSKSWSRVSLSIEDRLDQHCDYYDLSDMEEKLCLIIEIFKYLISNDKEFIIREIIYVYLHETENAIVIKCKSCDIVSEL